MAKYKTTLNGLRKMLTSVNNKMQQQRRQLQGDAFDLDALTGLYTDIHSGKSPDERIYLSQRKKNKDLAILVLLDISLSSDGCRGNRVIDVEKKFLFYLAKFYMSSTSILRLTDFILKPEISTYLTLKDFNRKLEQSQT